MDKNTLKVLKFYNSHSQEMYSIAATCKIFSNISTNDMKEILEFLYSNGYLRIIQGNLYQSTLKGKSYKAISRNKWISEHIVETFALIISFLSLIVSIIALIRTFIFSN